MGFIKDRTVFSGSPELNFTNEIKKFYGEDDEKFSMSEIFGFNKDVDEAIICKIQKLDDLNKVKQMFPHLHQLKDNCINNMIGGKCYLFLENGEIKIKTIKDYIYTKKFNTKFGLIICQDNGEWGGNLSIITNENEEYRFYSIYYAFEFVFENNDKVYVLSSLAHLGGYDCSLHEIRKSGDDFEIITIFESEDMYFSGYYVDENYLYFYSNDSFNGLCKFNLEDNQLEIIHSNLCESINVSSLIKKDNFVYIYGDFNIVKYDLNSHEIDSIYTNLDYDDISEYWFVNDNEKLIDVWDDYII